MRRFSSSPWWTLPAALLCLAACLPGTAAAIDIYVPGYEPTIQAGIDAASPGDRVIVDDGVYTGPGNRDLSFDGKAITVKSFNGPENCIIDCQQAGNGFNFENGEGAGSVLDGFTILNGSVTYGGGIYINGCSPTVKNCILLNNRGYDGIAAGYGGGIYCYAWVFGGACRPRIENCVFIGNSADYGGGIYNYSDGVGSTTEPTLVHCTFRGNHADLEGGGIYNYWSDPTVTSTIVWGNTAGTLYPGVRDFSSNAFITYSDVQGGFAGTGNIEADPLFAGAGDFRLTSGSPCIDTGTSAGVAQDIEGDARPYLTGYDMGADEYFEPCWDRDFDGVTDAACGGEDCNDASAFIFPGNPNPYCDCADPHPQGAEEIPNDGVDNDCDGLVDEGCFIATASFGTGMSGKIHPLRSFRDRVLNASSAGRALVRTYYDVSPPVADFIARHGWLKTLVRTLLLPVVGLASLLV